MTIEELYKLDSEKILFIDIREENELKTLKSPAGAVHMPMSKVVAQAQEGTLPKEKMIVTICRTGSRCAVLNNFLISHGYKDANYIEGGILGIIS